MVSARRSNQQPIRQVIILAALTVLAIVAGSTHHILSVQQARAHTQDMQALSAALGWLQAVEATNEGPSRAAMLAADRAEAFDRAIAALPEEDRALGRRLSIAIMKATPSRFDETRTAPAGLDQSIAGLESLLKRHKANEDRAWLFVEWTRFVIVVLVLIGLTAGWAVLISDMRRRNAALEEATLALERHQVQLEEIVRQRTQSLEEQTRAAEAANEAKSAFLAQMSHEIRTPLNGVIGMASVLTRAKLDPEHLALVKLIETSGENLLVILNDILDMSKIEAGKLTFEEIDFDITELAVGAAALFRERAKAKELDFYLDIAHSAASWRRGDPTRVRQIIYNLLSNAIKFTSKGSVALMISSVRAGDGQDQLLIEVADTGIGMSAQTLEALFKPFQQADVTTSRRFGGTGLGLAICREMAERMGGSIRVESTPGEGSTFQVLLPLAQGTQPDEDEWSELEDAPGDALSVLAAEDHEVNRLVLARILDQINARVRFASNGSEAVALHAQDAFDLILMDIQMPEMDGVQATRAIRAQEAARGGARTPIIALTANAMTHQLVEYAAAGMDDHVAKPIQPAKLFAKITAVLNRQAPSAAA